jgi:hypothetical protein
LPSKFKPILTKEEIPKKIEFKEIPEGLVLKRGELFCPLCGNASKFVDDDYYKNKRCPFCSLSSEDFWVKTVNHLWDKIKKN